MIDIKVKYLSNLTKPAPQRLSKETDMTSGTPSSQVTAGFLNTDWNPRDLPPGATTRNTVLRTA
ncbi:hypothetical protein, partial [Elizabethkingia meningoseptica]|uniref:hypothetical protein n=1 Tax=Elizabethkingia meningoseptica TaxID=238 RepID=UPI003191EA6C